MTRRMGLRAGVMMNEGRGGSEERREGETNLNSPISIHVYSTHSGDKTSSCFQMAFFRDILRERVS